MRAPARSAAATIVVVLAAAPAAAALHVVASEPAPRTLGASLATPVVLRFDAPVDRSSITPLTFWAFGKTSGVAAGSFSFSDGDRVVTLTPDGPFAAGENVMVVLAKAIAGTAGGATLAHGHAYQFWTRAQPAGSSWAEIDTLSTRSFPLTPTQAYGGVSTDFNADGWADLSIVNEISADLRVFLNRADGGGLFDPFLVPPSPVGNRASPSDPSDFNRDGLADLCVANIDDDTVSILLGHGDGTFAPQQTVAVGPAPRGIAALDVDGDGDTDIVNTNSQAGLMNLSLLLNNGAGVFGPATFFPSGASGAWALAAGDMNQDGILDLVIGARTQQRIVVHLGQGDGTFLPSEVENSAGAVWMLVLGDVNGDGTEDVAAVNSTSNNGAIFLGDGAGHLSAAQVYPTGSFTLASDLADLDGDLDLDWLTSSYGGDWRLFENNGAGAFTLDESFDPTSAASCALAVDLENDRDLDLALIDEVADEVVLLQHDGIGSPPPPPPVPGALLVGKLDPLGHDLALRWDVLSCPATNHHLVHGGGAQLPSQPGGVFSLSGSRCGIGANQPFQWIGTPSDPSGIVWFLLVADDGIETEGSWGLDSAGNERSGPAPGGGSGACGVLVKNALTPCVARPAAQRQRMTPSTFE